MSGCNRHHSVINAFFLPEPRWEYASALQGPKQAVHVTFTEKRAATKSGAHNLKQHKSKVGLLRMFPFILLSCMHHKKASANSGGFFVVDIFLA
jgi:hypothetical protein